MNLAKIAFDHSVVTWMFIFMLIAGGITSFNGMARLEDPEFTIKDAVVVTAYPGASALEVEAEVTDRIEKAVQEMGQLKEIYESTSYRGLSVIKFRMKDKYDKAGLPQVWDELRRKVGDVQVDLPPGAGPSVVNDDFGDVYGIFAALTGEGYTMAELKDVAEMLRKELSLVTGVSRVEFFGEQQEVIYVEPDRDRMAMLGVSSVMIADELRARSLVSNSGNVVVGSERVTLDPSAVFETPEEFGKIVLSNTAGGSQIYLRDVATISRGYQDPPSMIQRFDGQASVALGISTVQGGNVVIMGEALKIRMAELEERIPIGVEIGIIAMQPDAVNASISGFLVSLGQAVVIVVVVLLLFMGLRTGLLIGFILFLTIAGSFIFLASKGVILERISLGALIIALGMLVDNAIVVTDGMLIKMEQGTKPKKAAIEMVGQTAIPLLGATAIAILAFAAIGTSQDKTGEYTRSLYTVILVSLSLSWVIAMTATPVLAAKFLKVKPPKDGKVIDPYDTKFYHSYRSFLTGAIRYRWVTMGIVVAIFVASLMGFKTIEGAFFPNSSRNQFMVEYWIPQGSDIRATETDVIQIEEHILAMDGVKHVATTVGKGAIRFLLTYNAEKSNNSYAVMLVEVDDYKQIDVLKPKIQEFMVANFPQSIPTVKRFINGPAEPGGAVQFKVIGPDPVVLRAVADQARAIFEADSDAFGVRLDWGDRVPVVRPIIATEQANLAGLSRPDIANALQEGFSGKTIGVYREDIELMPIVMRAPAPERLDMASIHNLQIWSPIAGKMIPLTQVVTGFETVWEDQVISRNNRRRAITVFADAEFGLATTLMARTRPLIDAIELPSGYETDWWGEFKSTNEAQASLGAALPPFLLMMVIIVIMLFNSIKQTLVIWLVVPLGIVGVTVGLLSTGLPFNFLALLGFLSLIGMMIKNAIVLIDEINTQVDGGAELFDAILSAGVSRLRPVGMAAATTVLGMAPLFTDPFFDALAMTVAAGLTFATVLTMVVVPVLYALIFRVPTPRKQG